MFQHPRADWRIAITALSIAAGIACPLRAEMRCDMIDDGDCCVRDVDCVAAVNASLCAIVPLNRTTARKVEIHDPEMSLCDAERIAELRREAAPMAARCEAEVCQLVGDDGSGSRPR